MKTLVGALCALSLLLVASPAGAQLPPGSGPDGPDGTIHEPDPHPFSAEMLDRLESPPGVEVEVFAADAGNVRMMQVMENGDVYVTRRSSGDLLLLRDGDGDGAAETRRTVAQNVPLLHGITTDGESLYLVANNHVYTAAIQPDGSLGDLVPIVDDLPDAGQHSARTIAFGPDGYLYVSVGSTCNSCDEANPENATIVRMLPDGSARNVYVRGVRHTIGFGWHPDTGEMWGMDQGSDWRGDDQPPEELNALVANRDFGWPFCFGDRQADPFLAAVPPGETKPVYCARTEAPTIEYTAHGSPIGMLFLTGDVLGGQYDGDALVAMRGSWNRSVPSGYEVVRIDFEDGQPVAFEPFVSGWLLDPAENTSMGGDPARHGQFGRIAGLATWTDGSVLVSEDQNGVIYRLSTTGEE